MIDVPQDVLIWLVGWSFVGSSLGYLTLRHKPQWTGKVFFIEYFKSVGVGIFSAFPTFFILHSRYICSMPISLMLAGSLAFIATDAIIHVWPKLMESIGVIIVALMEKLLGIGRNNGRL